MTRKNGARGGGSWQALASLSPLQIFAIVDFLLMDNDSEKKKSVVKMYKSFEIP